MPSNMPAYVRELVLKVIDREGGIANDIIDRGGFTNLGITKPYLTRFLGRPATDADISGLTVETSLQVYYHNTWLGEKLDLLINYPILQDVVFDWCVNSGDNAGTMALQHIVGVNTDGAIGAKTLAAIDKYMKSAGRFGEEKLVNALVVYRIEKYCRIVQSDSSQLKYIWGWIDRAIKLLQFNFG